MVVKNKWGVSKVFLFRKEMGNKGPNWVLQSRFRAVLKMRMNRFLSINDWHFMKRISEFQLFSEGSATYILLVWASYCQCLTLDSSVTRQFHKNSLQWKAPLLRRQERVEMWRFLLWQFLLLHFSYVPIIQVSCLETRKNLTIWKSIA